jgi:hypothetical protein
MTPHTLFSVARSALRLARCCIRDATCYDRAWHVYMLTEARRHRERAAWYLSRRRMILQDMELQ